MRASIAAVTAVCAVLGTARADDGKDRKGSPWAGVEVPSTGTPEAIGRYNAGCVKGAVALPESGRGFQVLRRKRQRFFGHPDLVAVIKGLGRKWAREPRGVMLVGDMGQPRGGPAPSGHSSHQSGLDVDVWFWTPSKRLSAKHRERATAQTVVDLVTKSLNGKWRRKFVTLLRLAAEDRRTSRIFVNPVIKKHLCESVKGKRRWLRKIRPWYGHHEHFHVRLHCPKRSPECVAQAPLPRGDGCDELSTWLDDKAQAERKQNQAKYSKSVGAQPSLPEKCAAVAAE